MSKLTTTDTETYKKRFEKIREEILNDSSFETSVIKKDVQVDAFNISKELFNKLYEIIIDLINRYNDNDKIDIKGLSNLVGKAHSLIKTIDELKDFKDIFEKIVINVIIPLEKQFMIKLTENIQKSIKEINLTELSKEDYKRIKNILDKVIIKTAEGVKNDYNHSLSALATILEVDLNNEL